MSTWIKPRHNRVYRFCAPPFRWFLRKKYGFSYRPYTLQKGPHLILCNHQTKHDQFILSLLFEQMLYFVCRDDIIKSGLVGRAVSYLCAPIPKSKVAKDIKTIRICRQIVHEGGNVALFPEGNLTLDGQLGGIDISAAKLIKLLNVPVVFVNIRGGYGVLPRWHHKGRRGYFTAQVVNVMGCEQYKNLSPEQLLQVIVKNLSVEELNMQHLYPDAKRAEYLESLLYVCPNCGFSKFLSHKNTVKCTKCGTRWTYNQDLTFTPSTPFINTAEWQQYQREYVRTQTQTTNTPIFCDRIKAIRVQRGNAKRTVMRNCKCYLYLDKLLFCKKKTEINIFFDDMTGFAVLGKNKIEFANCGQNYYVIPRKRVNAVKYMHFYTRSKVLASGQDDQYLGF